MVSKSSEAQRQRGRRLAGDEPRAGRRARRSGRGGLRTSRNRVPSSPQHSLSVPCLAAPRLVTDLDMGIEERHCV